LEIPESSTDSAITNDLVDNEVAISEHEELDEIREDEAWFTDIDKSKAILPSAALARSEQTVSNNLFQSQTLILQCPTHQSLPEPGHYWRLARYSIVQ
jgi:hypothetical protein